MKDKTILERRETEMTVERAEMWNDGKRAEGQREKISQSIILPKERNAQEKKYLVTISTFF